MPVHPDKLPQFDPLGRPALLGLVYRALAADADPAEAQLTLRRIEHTASDYTVAAQKRSQLRSALEIARQHAHDGEREALRLDLDLQIFNRNHPPPAKRGLFAPRRSPDEQQRDSERRELEQQLALLQQDTAKLQAKSAELAKLAAGIEQAYSQLSAERDDLNARFRREVAAGVLSLAALGEFQRAREVVADGRRMLRGDLVLGTLWVLLALFAEGPAAAARELKETQAIWEQHADPVARVLEGYLRLLDGAELNREQLGIFPRGQFSHAGLWRLYLLLGALGGWPPPDAAPDSADLLPTLQALYWQRTQAATNAWALDPAPSALADWAGRQDVVCRTIVANILLRSGNSRWIPHAAGFSGLADIEPLHYIPQPRKAGQRWSELLPTLLRQPLPDWPRPLQAAWTAGLACHVLLATPEHGPSALYEQWLEDSRGWPPSALHFWTQAALRGEPGILSNLAQADPGLFTVKAA